MSNFACFACNVVPKRAFQFTYVLFANNARHKVSPVPFYDFWQASNLSITIEVVDILMQSIHAVLMNG